MAGIKIHQYPLERTSIGDEDYYDIDYYTGSGYQSAKIKGSTLKNVLGANYIDIQDFTSGYTLKPTDAGKLITNAGSPFRDLIVDTTLQAPGHGFTVKGKVEIKPTVGVNIDLPDGSTITNPNSFICGSQSFYVLQRKGFTGTDWILVEVQKSENIGTNDLIITDTIRELQVAENGTFQIVTNDASNSAIFKVGENNNERFSEIEFNTVIFDLISKFQNPAITDGVIVEVNPNEFKFSVLPDTSNTSVYHGLISVDANKTIIEKSNAGKFLFDSALSSNTFEDLRATKKGIEYLADYSADFSLNSLIDKRYGLSIGLERVTTLQMNALPSPFSDKLVFNTDLKAIYRYDQPSLSWVALSAGYGIIGVYSGTGNGTPTFFATLQSALETCKASGGYFTVKLYSNLTITSAINIRQTGTGVGNAYNYRQLTIDLNGFSITNNQTDDSKCFDVILSQTVVTQYQEIRFLNGNVFRNNGTGTHFAIEAFGWGTVQMSKMFWYCQNSSTARIQPHPISTAVGINKVCDLGGSTFVSQNGSAIHNSSQFMYPHLMNFNAISHSSAITVYGPTGTFSHFTCENTSTGAAIKSGTGSDPYNLKVHHFIAKSNSGTAVQAVGTLTHFYAESVSGIAVANPANTGPVILDNFVAVTGNNTALQLTPGFDSRWLSNGKCVNNSSLPCVNLYNFGAVHNIEALNNGSGVAMIIGTNQGTRNEVTGCKATSMEGVAASISALDVNKSVNIHNCVFNSRLNTSGGHAVFVGGTNLSKINITHCHFIVRNASANAINATSAITVNSRYCTHNDVASTPINANVTIVSSGIIS